MVHINLYPIPSKQFLPYAVHLAPEMAKRIAVGDENAFYAVTSNCHGSISQGSAFPFFATSRFRLSGVRPSGIHFHGNPPVEQTVGPSKRQKNGEIFVKRWPHHKARGSSAREICDLEKAKIQFASENRVRRVRGRGREGRKKHFERATHRLGTRNSDDAPADARLLNFFSTPNAMQLRRCAM